MRRIFDVYTSLVLGFVVYNWLLNGSLFNIGSNIPENKAVLFFVGYVVVGIVTIIMEFKND